MAEQRVHPQFLHFREVLALRLQLLDRLPQPAEVVLAGAVAERDLAPDLCLELFQLVGVFRPPLSPCVPYLAGQSGNIRRS